MNAEGAAEGRPGTLGRLALRCQPDARLVALTREGSDAAFEEVVGRYQSRLVGFAAGIARRDRAEDVVQESLMRALASIRETDADINLRPWLYTIVRNRALNDRRDEPALEHLDEEYDGVPQPPDVAARRAELASVVERVKALPDAQREALVQRELGGRSHEEIAAAMDVTPGAIRGLIFRARSSLRNVAGLAIPMPLVRAAAGTSGGGAATVAAATGGGGGMIKLGATLGVAALAIGSGVALHERSSSGVGQADAKDLPKVAIRSAANPGRASTAGRPAPGGALPAVDDRSGSSRRGNSPAQRHGSSNKASGSNGASSGGSSGPDPVSGSSGSGSGSGSSSGPGPAPGSGGPGPGGGGGGGEPQPHGGPGPGSGGDGGGDGGSGDGGGPTTDGGSGGGGTSDGGTSDGGSGDGSGHSGGGDGGGGVIPPPTDGSGGDGGGSGGGDGGSSGSSGGDLQAPPPGD